MPSADADRKRLIDSEEWTITDTVHDLDCAGCADAAERAAIHAKVTGSVGATYADEFRGVDGELTVRHRATVTRNEQEDA